MTAPDALELTPRLAVDDTLFHAVGTTLKAEVEAGCAGGRAYGESLAGTLAMHLVRHYSNRRPQPAGDGTRLSRHQLRRAIDFMHDRLAEDLSLNDIAAEAGLSVFHFARLFRQTTGLAPHQYLIQCRVERAKQLILASSAATAGIAQQVGFCDQSHLTVHFRRIYGVTPKQFRAQMGLRKEPV
jgi:AraC family transcriptional regulator